jgi:hypothetical protein
MEIPPLDNEINKLFELNNELLRLYKSYVFYSNDVLIRDEKRFIGSVYKAPETMDENGNDSDRLILRIEYMVFGSYTKEKNVWIWADQSQSINKKNKTMINNLRSSVIESLDQGSEIWTEKLKSFCTHDYMVIPTIELCKQLNHLSIFVSEKNKGYIFLTLERGNIIDILIVKKILFNNIKN